MTERSPDEDLDNARAAEAARRWAESFEDAGRTATAALAAKLAKKDLERAREAYRLFGTANGPEDVDGLAVAAYAARLGCEGWEPEDPLWIEAWRLCDEIDQERYPGSTTFSECRSKNDRSPRLVYAALKRGMELAKERG